MTTVRARPDIERGANTPLYSIYGSNFYVSESGIFKPEKESRFNPRNKAFDFSFNDQDAVLWIGENAELI